MGKRGSDYTTPPQWPRFNYQHARLFQLVVVGLPLAKGIHPDEKGIHIFSLAQKHTIPLRSPQIPTYSTCPLVTVCCSLVDLWTVYCYSVRVVNETIKELQIHFHRTNFLCP